MSNEVSKIHDALTAAGPMFSGNDDICCHEIAGEWLAYEFTAKDVKQWIETECWDPGTAAKLRDAGFNPQRDTLSYVADHERDDMSAMYAFCNNDVNIEHVTW